MCLFDFWFPEEAQAMHLRRLADQQERRDRIAAEAAQTATETQAAGYAALENRIRELERDLGFVSLVLGGLLSALETKSAVTRADVCSAMEELDATDHTRDERLDINVLRTWSRPPTE